MKSRNLIVLMIIVACSAMMVVDLQIHFAFAASHQCVDCVNNGAGGMNCEAKQSGGTTCTVDGSGKQCSVTGVCTGVGNGD